MASKPRKVGKGKARGRSTRRKRRSRPPVAPHNATTASAPPADTPVEQPSSGLKSPPARSDRAAAAAEASPEAPGQTGAVAADPNLALLTRRRRRFVEEVLISGNGTQAAILAGFSPDRADVEASELLKDPLISGIIARREADLYQRLGISQERILTEKAAIALSDHGDFFTEGPDGEPRMKRFADIPPLARKAIKSIKVKRVVPQKDESEGPYEILEFSLWDKPAQLDKMEARLDSQAVANKGVDLANLSDKERLRIIAEVLSRGRAARDAVIAGKQPKKKSA